MFTSVNSIIIYLATMEKKIAKLMGIGMEKHWQVLGIFRNMYLHYSLELGKSCQVILRKPPGPLNTNCVVLNSTA